MIGLFVFTLATFGVAFVVGSSKITLPLRAGLDTQQRGFAPSCMRWLLALMECAACTSWHLGWLAFALHLTPPVFHHWWTTAFYCCATSLILARIAGLDEAT